MSNAGDRALEALKEYRSRHEVTDPGVACLLSRASSADALEGAARRREELIRRAVADGVPAEAAEQVYAIALEEGVEPAFAFELARCRVGVLDLEEAAGQEPTDDGLVIQGPPEEMLEPAPDADVMRRERRLRASYRRLRTHLERSDTAEAALRAFAAEPDVGQYRDD
jgi:hypothetical protein